MNEQQAIDLATENCITVTTTRKTKLADAFKVGRFELIRRKGQKEWMVVGENVKFRVGEAIEYCVRKELSE